MSHFCAKNIATMKAADEKRASWIRASKTCIYRVSQKKGGLRKFNFGAQQNIFKSMFRIYERVFQNLLDKISLKHTNFLSVLLFYPN